MSRNLGLPSVHFPAVFSYIRSARSHNLRGNRYFRNEVMSREIDRGSEVRRSWRGWRINQLSSALNNRSPSRSRLDRSIERRWEYDSRTNVIAGRGGNSGDRRWSRGRESIDRSRARWMERTGGSGAYRTLAGVSDRERLRRFVYVCSGI